MRRFQHRGVWAEGHDPAFDFLSVSQRELGNKRTVFLRRQFLVAVPVGFADVAGDVASEVNANRLQFRRTTAEDAEAVFQPVGKIEILRDAGWQFREMHVVNAVHLVGANFSASAGPGNEIQTASMEHKSLRIHLLLHGLG